MVEAEKTKFDSVILAGGFGKRLAPLTDSMPKPMLPIANESAFSRNLTLLRSHGFSQTAVTTMYLPEKLKANGFEGVEFLFEETPLGSAGAVGKIKHRARDCVIILSGDAVCDFDLAKAKEDFLKSNCDGGILLSREKDVGEYGTVCLKDGKIIEFCEKPSARDALSDLVNTGIYFLSRKALSLIPENQFYDFSKDLFPKMLDLGFSIAGIEPEGMWFDIGSFGDYHKCNMWVSKGENCIGSHVSVHPSARIDCSVVFDNCTVGDSILRGCIVAENVVIGNDCIIPSGCVIGNGAELRDGTVLAPGSIVAPNETVKGKAFCEWFPKPKQCLTFDDDCVIASDDDEGYFVKLGRLLGGEGSVIAFAEGSGNTLQQACELSCGAAKAGSPCTVIAGGNAVLAAFASKQYDAVTAFISRVGEKTQIRLFAEDGMAFSRERLRKLSAKTPVNSKISGSVYLLPHGVLIKRYLAHIKENCKIPSGISFISGDESRFAREVAEELGILKAGDTIFGISHDGEKAFAVLPNGREVNYWQLLTLCCIESKKDEITLPRDTPDAVEGILNRRQVKTKFYSDSESETRKEAAKEFMHRDGTILALTVAEIAEKKGVSLAELLAEIPPFAIMTRAIYADSDKMFSVIAKLREEHWGTRNAGFDFGYGRVSVYPSAAGRFRLVAEAVDAETAEEISLKAIDLLDKK